MSVELAETTASDLATSRPSTLRAAAARAAALHQNGQSGEAHALLTEALQARGASDQSDDYLDALRRVVTYADATRRPELVLAAASRLRAHLESLRRPSAALRDELSDVLLLEAETAMMARAGGQALPLASRALEIRRSALSSRKSRLARARLIDALTAMVRLSLGSGNDAGAAGALSEAESELPARLPSEPAWQARATLIFRLKAALAQRQNRHAEAVDAFEAALARQPHDAGPSARDANAARLQLYVGLARSRLALGQGAETKKDAEICHSLLAALQGVMPEAALGVIRAAVLANDGSARALLGELPAAEEKFGAAVELIDKLGRPDLADVKRQVIEQWAGALMQQGRAAEAAAIRARMAEPQPHQHSANCGCGHNHHDGHDHGHGHDQHQGHTHAAHDHAHHSHAQGHHHQHAHGAGCSCCSD